MRYEEFRRQLGKAGLTIREFADLMRLRTNSVSNYAATDSVPAHLAVVATLMGEMAEHGLDFRGPLARLDLQPKKARGAGSFGRDGQLELPV